MSKKEYFSRRDFLKLASYGIFGLFIEPINRNIELFGPVIEVPSEVKRWGMVGPDQLITQSEIDEEIEPNLVKLIDYIPGVVVSDYTLAQEVVLDPLIALSNASLKAGVRFRINCGFRDLAWQAQAYDKSYTNGVPSGYIAPPGRSQHHTGLAVDFQSLNTKPYKGNGFENTPEGRWLDMNADRFGFVRSFLGGVNKKLFTPEESWHFMYVGEDIAAEHFRRRTMDPHLEYYEFLNEMLYVKQKQEDLWDKRYYRYT